uniref:ATP dependent RNA helicase n=1 Tax=bacterium AK-MB40 TaxID=1136515 RepID=B2RGD2_UNCXX|nr:ATP dependent RNA helicase [bacterium AK-MB40]
MADVHAPGVMARHRREFIGIQQQGTDHHHRQSQRDPLCPQPGRQIPAGHCAVRGGQPERAPLFFPNPFQRTGKGGGGPLFGLGVWGGVPPDPKVGMEMNKFP